ncbi:MAG: Slp family lipoprotein [Nitrospirae bacterium]|nr:Slp family lipoprotein [Nitrospirota bacterium]
MKMIAVLFSIMLFVQGCAYAISPGMADKADKTVLFEKLQADPDSFKGKLIIMGGTIAQTSDVNQGTLIEVTQKPLDYWGKPERTKRTGGRFLVFHRGPLNLMAYAPGVDITIAGEVLETGSPMLGGKQYDYPVLFAKELKLWEQEPRSHDKPRWMDPLHDPANSGRPE